MGAVFEELNKLNVNDHTEKKKTGGTELTYLSWTWAWAEIKKRFPDARYEIVMHDGLPYVYDENTGYMVFTRVTIQDITHSMWLPVMDGANKAMKAVEYSYYVKNPLFKYAVYDKESGKYVDKYGKTQEEYIEKTVNAATMFDVNKTLMRCLVKNLAMFGLGLYIYAGEDVPGSEEPPEEPPEGPDTLKPVKPDALKSEKVVQANIDKSQELRQLLTKNSIPVNFVCGLYNVSSLGKMSDNQLNHAIERIDVIKKKQEEMK